MNGKRTADNSSNQTSIGRPAGTSSRDADPERTSILDGRLPRLERLQSVPLKFLRFHAVRDRTGLSRSMIWRLERRGEFPKHRRISSNAVGWVEAEIVDWMLTKAAG